MKLKIDLEKFLEETAEIIAMESPSDVPEGTNEVALYFKKGFDEIGWKTELIQADPSVGPFLKVVNTDEDTYDALIIGHMDTVFEVGTVKEPVTIVGDKAYGPAIGDMKSNILLNLYACREIAKHEKQPKICVFYNSDEEISSKFSKEMIKELARKSKITLVLEGAREDGSLVASRKGIAKYIFTVTGRAAHAGANHADGLNSIDEFAGIVKKLHPLTNYEAGTTLNVGVMRGGTKVNVVPEFSYGELDIRYQDNREIDKIHAVFDELISDGKKRGFEITFKENGGRPPMNPIEGTEHLMREIEKIGEEIGMNITWGFSGGGSDANFTANEGTPSIDGFGPIAYNSHSITDEFIIVSSIEPMYNLLYEVILHSKDIEFN